MEDVERPGGAVKTRRLGHLRPCEKSPLVCVWLRLFGCGAILCVERASCERASRRASQPRLQGKRRDTAVGRRAEASQNAGQGLKEMKENKEEEEEKEERDASMGLGVVFFCAHLAEVTVTRRHGGAANTSKEGLGGKSRPWPGFFLLQSPFFLSFFSCNGDNQEEPIRFGPADGWIL